MGVIYTFSYSDWVGQFPMFAAVSAPQATGFFNRATIIWANDGTGPVASAAQQETLLNLLTSHIAWLSAFRDDNGMPSSTGTIPPPSAVGRVSNASEGSVSVALDMGDANAGSPSQAWYMQTQFGSEFWAATAQFRTGLFVPPRRPTAPATAIFPSWPGGAR
jgi:hypothetical protein